MVFMALKVAHDMKVFPVLANATSPVSAKQLAAAKPANPLLVGAFLPHLMVHVNMIVNVEFSRANHAPPGVV